MPPRYTLGLNLENEDDYQGGLSRAVEEALLPSASQEVAPASEPAYSFDGPKINLGELQDSTPAATEDTVAETNYLAQLMGQANEVKALREKASTLAAQELSPEQSIASAILSAVPALLGLAAAGKRGFVGAGSVSGPAGALYAEARRKDMLEQSKQVGSQADALQQALQLGIKERGAEERQAQRDKAALERTNAAIRGAANKAEEIEKNKVAREEAKSKALLGEGKIPIRKDLPLDKVEDLAEQDYKNDVAFGTLLNTIKSAKDDWNSLTDSEKATRTADIVLLAKGENINKGGSAFSAMEKRLNQAGVPVTLTPLSDFNDIREYVAQNLSKIPPDKLFNNLIDFYGNRYYDSLTVSKPDLTSEKYSYLAPYIRNPIDSQREFATNARSTATTQTGMFSNNFRSTLQNIAAGK